MAGKYKPSDDVLIGSKNEARYTFLSDVTTPHGSRGEWKGAFDGGTGGLYMDYDLKIQFYTTVNIYVIDNYLLNSNGYRGMHIYNEDKTQLLNDEYFNKSNNVYNKWDIVFKGVKPGIYVINGGTSKGTLISELFIEDEVFHLIHSNNKYYSPNDKYYDINNKVYTDIPVTTENSLQDIFKNNHFDLNALFEEVNINDEIFKPIDKFKNLSIIKLI